MHNGIDIGLFLDKVSSKKGVLNPKETLKAAFAQVVRLFSNFGFCTVFGD